MVEEEDGRGEAGTGRLGRLGNTGAFCAHGCGGGCFGAGRALVPAARGILGTNHNHSWQRFVGTALGAVVGAIVASHFGPHVLVFGASVFMLGLLCPLALADRSAYRFGGTTLAIVLLIPRAGPAWETAFHRFAEVSIGIGVALILTVVWPEREAAALVENVNDSPRKTDGDQGRLNELPRSPRHFLPLQTRDLERVALRHRERTSGVAWHFHGALHARI